MAGETLGSGLKSLAQGTHTSLRGKERRVQRPPPQPRLVPGRGWVTSGKLDWKGVAAGLSHDRNKMSTGRGDGVGAVDFK